MRVMNRVSDKESCELNSGESVEMMEEDPVGTLCSLKITDLSAAVGGLVRASRNH